jgi:hypothetical protein
MERITNDGALRTRLSEAGPRRAAAFSWKTTAEATLAALAERPASRPFASSG